MEIPRLKKGTIRKVEDDRITLLNVDGQCEDSFPIYPDFARQIRTNIEPSEPVFYVIEGEELVGIGLEEWAPPDLKNLYAAWPKETECSYWENKPDN